MIRIANYSGFYGDRHTAALEQVEGGEIDVLCGDYLAELTMLILFKDRMKNPDGGYAKTFLPALKDVLAPCLDRKIKIVVNAGGLNPAGLGRAVRAAAQQAGLSPRVAVVEGDDLIADTAGWLQGGGQALRHQQTGEPLNTARGQVLTANAYLGMWPIVRALEAGADIVITGRGTDAAVVMGPAAWFHRWSPTDYDAIAGALVAGHIIECGCQATGGNYSFWEEVPSFHDVGFPIAEIAADGSSVICKHAGTGGLVSIGTVTAQLLYEVQGQAYYSPDAIAHFETIALEDVGPDRVAVTGVRGSPPTELLKLGISLTAGYRNQVKVLLSGQDAEAKAGAVSDVFWRLVGTDFEETRTDFVYQARLDPATENDNFSTLVFSARDRSEAKVGRAFTNPAIELALASVPGYSLVELPGRPQLCGMFWPTLLDRSQVTMRYSLDEGEPVEVAHPPAGDQRVDLPQGPTPAPTLPSGDTRRVPLGTLVGSRSGDKGGNANVGFWVREDGHVAWLLDTLIEARIRRWLPDFTGKIDRYPLPNLRAVNFVLHGILGDGVAASLKPDPQGKALGEFFRSKLVDVDVALLN